MFEQNTNNIMIRK